MTTLFARKSDNWDASQVWNDKQDGTGNWVTPGQNDVCMANGFTVTVNISPTVWQVRNDTTGSATAGGSFTLSNGVILTGSVYVGYPATCVTFSLDSPNSAKIIGAINGGTNSTSYAVLNNGTGILNIQGNCVIATSTAVYNQNSGIINITGNLTGGNGNEAHGVVNYSSGTVNITGNLTGGSLASTQYHSFAAFNNGSGTINISGNATGGSYSTQCGAGNNSTGAVNITGISTGGSASLAYGCINFSTGIVYINGTVQASATAAGVSGSNVGQLTYLTGPLLSTTTAHGTAAASGVNPCTCTRWFVKDADLGGFYMTLRGDAVSDGARPARTLYIAESVTSDNSALPAPANVRSGISYAVNNVLTGTCHVPAAASVLYGVPVDATTGTAEVSGADPAIIAAAVWDRLLADMDTSDSAGARLKQLASTDAVGGIVAALGA